MWNDLPRRFGLLLVERYHLLALYSTVFLPLLFASGVAALAGEGPVFILSLLASLLAVVGSWVWVWLRLRPRLHEDFCQAARRLGAQELGEEDRHRLRVLIDRILPEAGNGSVLRAFLTRSGGQELYVAEWLVDRDRVLDGLNAVQLLVVAAQAAESLPTFHLQPEGPLTRLGERLHRLQGPEALRRASADVDFVRDPGWSRAWFLCGPDRRTLRGFFGRKMRDAFRCLKGWRLSGRGSWLVLRFRGAVSPSALAARVREASRVAARVERLVATA